jgi:hypothetical protein
MMYSWSSSISGISPTSARWSTPGPGRRSVSGWSSTVADEAATTRPDASSTWTSWLGRVVSVRSCATPDVPSELTWLTTSAARPSAASDTPVISARCRSNSSTAAPSAIATATTITAAAVDLLRTLARRSSLVTLLHTATKGQPPSGSRR